MSVSVCMYVYIYMYTCACLYIYVHTYYMYMRAARATDVDQKLKTQQCTNVGSIFTYTPPGSFRKSGTLVDCRFMNPTLSYTSSPVATRHTSGAKDGIGILLVLAWGIFFQACHIPRATAEPMIMAGVIVIAVGMMGHSNDNVLCGYCFLSNSKVNTTQ